MQITLTAPVLISRREAGLISEQAAKADPRRHALHSALTGERIPLQDLSLQPVLLTPNDVLIFATDGLLTLSGDAIATLVRKHHQDPPQRLADELICGCRKGSRAAPRQYDPRCGSGPTARLRPRPRFPIQIAGAVTPAIRAFTDNDA